MIYTAQTRVGTAITAHFGTTLAPTVYLFPAGHENDSVSAGTFWVIVTPETDEDGHDGGGGVAYIGSHNLLVTAWIQDAQADLGSTAQNIGTKAAGLRDSLRYKTLGGYVRPSIDVTDMGAGKYLNHTDDSSRYGYSFTVRVTHQYP
jgi:hypothetical protein